MKDLNGRINIRIYNDERGVEVIYDNDPHNAISIIGSLEIAKQLILSRLDTRLPRETEKEKQQKTMVGKTEAMKIYMELGNKLKDRILAIQRSEDNSRFDINPDLLSIV